MDRLRAFIAGATIGGLAFWTPVVLADFLSAPDRPNLLVVTIAPVLSVLLAYRMCVGTLARSRVSLALYMIAGIWLMGPAMITIGGSQHGMLIHEHLWLVPLSMVLPPLTWVLSGYHGSWFALNLGTLILIGIVVWQSSRATA